MTDDRLDCGRTPDQHCDAIERVESAVTDINTGVNEIKTALLGDLSGKKGLVQRVESIEEKIPEKAEARLDVLERNEKRRQWYIRSIWAAIVTIVTGWITTKGK